MPDPTDADVLREQLQKAGWKGAEWASKRLGSVTAKRPGPLAVAACRSLARRADGLEQEAAAFINLVPEQDRILVREGGADEHKGKSAAVSIAAMRTRLEQENATLHERLEAAEREREMLRNETELLCLHLKEASAQVDVQHQAFVDSSREAAVLRELRNHHRNCAVFNVPPGPCCCGNPTGPAAREAQEPEDAENEGHLAPAEVMLIKCLCGTDGTHNDCVLHNPCLARRTDGASCIYRADDGHKHHLTNVGGLSRNWTEPTPPGDGEGK